MAKKEEIKLGKASSKMYKATRKMNKVARVTNDIEDVVNGKFDQLAKRHIRRGLRKTGNKAINDFLKKIGL